MEIKSFFGNYVVDFVKDITDALKEEVAKDSYFIIDSNVFSLYKKEIVDSVDTGRTIIVEATEFNKNIDKCKEIIEELVAKNVRKNHSIVAIGGGIIQDIGSFIASILYRGISWSFVPTTMLSQTDSCIGSKTSINLGTRKNLVGSFYPPKRVYHYTKFLETLKEDDIKSGIGEMLHFYFYANTPFTEPLMDNYSEFLKEPVQLEKYIRESLAIKKSVIEIDEFDKGERNLFNYGHTFGHALETVSGYRVSHGQSVTMGIDIANHISLNLGLLERKTYDYMRDILAKNLPDFKLDENNISLYLDALSKDKKNIGSDLVCILTNGPGAMIKKQLPINSDLKNIILAYFNK